MHDAIGAGTYRINKDMLYFTDERNDYLFDFPIIKLTKDSFVLLAKNEQEWIFKKTKSNEPSADIRKMGYAERIVGTWSETGDLSERLSDGTPNLISKFTEDGSCRYGFSNSARFYTVQEDLIHIMDSKTVNGNYSGQQIIGYVQILALTDNMLKLRYQSGLMGTVILLRVE